MAFGVTEWGAWVKGAGSYNEAGEWVKAPVQWFKTRNLRHRWVKRMEAQGMECETTERTTYMLPE